MTSVERKKLQTQADSPGDGTGGQLHSPSHDETLVPPLPPQPEKPAAGAGRQGALSGRTAHLAPGRRASAARRPGTFLLALSPPSPPARRPPPALPARRGPHFPAALRRQQARRCAARAWSLRPGRRPRPRLRSEAEARSEARPGESAPSRPPSPPPERRREEGAPRPTLLPAWPRAGRAAAPRPLWPPGPPGREVAAPDPGPPSERAPRSHPAAAFWKRRGDCAREQRRRGGAGKGGGETRSARARETQEEPAGESRTWPQWTLGFGWTDTGMNEPVMNE
ncbi:unnamed protein product [Rangifer tarandus platyrhynchus]|uniref:Uncharacterized protein n=1 Tax=Rangifer tarandus platyrhynchus TaxID=3082113 RepID=A0ABN8YNQ6_RANTA|nr:unnamed protein product [Rangifer tarandus platyrhynchus]